MKGKRKSRPVSEEPALLPADPLSVIGIGASVASVDALAAFLRAIPHASGAAYVVVSSDGALLAPVREQAGLPVVDAHDGTLLEADRIYAIPAGVDMTLLHGALHVLPQAVGRARTLPIDFFFRSLAGDQGERALGVILSGAGGDGALGLRAIKEAAGATFVQAPSNSIFEALADVVATAEELPARVLAYRDHAPFARHDQARQLDAQSAIDKICALLRDQFGNDFTVYKRSTIHRRIERRMGLQQIETFSEYAGYLREHPLEVQLLFSELLIGVTSFFRDPAEWDRLRHEVLPQLVTTRAAGGSLRAWVAGCSTGEEAYSLAILFREALEPVRALRNVTVQIFATDLDREAIEHARLGVYPENIAADVSPERLRRFFVRDDQGFRVSKDIRESVVFAPQNALMDPPFTKVDIVTCRNLMIYLSADVQKRLIPLFHYCLNPGGALFLGTAETVGTFANMFAPLDGRTRLYRRLEQPVALPLDLQLGGFGRFTSAPDDRATAASPGKLIPANLQQLVDRLLVQRFAPLGVLCNTKGDVLYLSGRAGRYLEPAVGKANLNIFAMARDGLRPELARAFALAIRQDHPVTVTNLKIGDGAHATMTIHRLAEPSELAGSVIVVLSELDPLPVKTARALTSGARKKAAPRLLELEEELQRGREEVQTIREEMQTSQEELKSTNEELQSTNEELQSTNEELTTSKEEMQSLNEELQTVNHELQSKVDELSRSNNDMKNLLNSTDIATLFLDADLRVRRFTIATAQIIKLITADLGRSITDIASELDVRIADDAREVLRTLIPQERLALARDGRAFSVRIMPYRTLDNVIDGVVITFTDATAARAQAIQLRQMAEALPHLVFAARADGSFDYLSRQWLDYTSVPEGEQLQWGWLEQLHPTDRERVREEWRRAVRAGANLDTELRIRSGVGGYSWFKVRAVPSRDQQGAIHRWWGSATDIDQLKRAEDRLAGMLASLRDGFVSLDQDLVVVAMNPVAERVLACRALDAIGHVLFEAVPAARPLEPLLARAPIETSLARVQRDHEGGYLIFLDHGAR